MRRADGSTYQIPKCLYARYRAMPHASLSGPLAVVAPTLTGDFIEGALSPLSGPDRFRQLTAKWQVPDAPVGSFPSDTVRVYYAFAALETLYDNDLVPALQYGFNGAFGGSYWTMTSWFYPDTGNVLYGPPISVAARDTVYGSVSASSCSNGKCTWTVIAGNSTLPRVASDTLTVASDSDAYGGAWGGRVDGYDITSCNQFPSPGVFFSSVTLSDTAGLLTNATFSNYAVYIPCYLKVTSNYLSGMGGVSLLHASLLDSVVTISGPSRVKPYASCWWWANSTSGGIPPYSYTWTPNGTPDGNAINMSWEASGTLSVYAADSLGQTTKLAQKTITVSPTAPTCPYRPAR